MKSDFDIDRTSHSDNPSPVNLVVIGECDFSYRNIHNADSVDVNYSGILNLKDKNKFSLNNSDIYNICYILSKNNDDRIDYDKNSNVFYTRFKPSNF